LELWVEGFVLLVWVVLFGTWGLVLGIWYLGFGMWCLAFGVWYVVLGALGRIECRGSESGSTPAQEAPVAPPAECSISPHSFFTCLVRSGMRV